MDAPRIAPSISDQLGPRLEDIQAAKTLEEIDQLLTRAMAQPKIIHPLIRGSNLNIIIQNVLEKDQINRHELMIAAVLGRLATVVHGDRRKHVFQSASRAILHEPGPIEDLIDGDGKAKGYAAVVLAHMDAPWINEYMTRQAIMIDTAENARIELLKSTLQRHKSIAKWISSIANHASALRQYPQSSRPRRVSRLLESVDSVAKEWHGNVGPNHGRAGSDIGTGLESCIGRFIGPTATNSDEPMLVRSLDHLYYVLLRSIELQFPIALDAMSYKSLNKGRSAIGIARWNGYLRQSTTIKKIRQVLLDAVLVLARQGRTDEVLTSTISAAYSSRRNAASAVSAKLREVADLDPQIAKWWNTLGDVESRRRQTEQRFGTTEDAQVGEILIGVERNHDAMSKIERVAVPLLEFSDDVLATTVRNAMRRYADIVKSARRLARIRKLDTTNLVGKRVEYNPIEQELIGGHRSGVRYVRIVRDGVRKDYGGRVKSLIKPWVEEIQEGIG